MLAIFFVNLTGNIIQPTVLVALILFLKVCCQKDAMFCFEKKILGCLN
jgi:hypothetical protein